MDDRLEAFQSSAACGDAEAASASPWMDWLPKNNTVAVRLKPEAAHLMARDAYERGTKTSTRAKQVIEEYYCGKPGSASDASGADTAALGAQFKEIVDAVRPVLEKKREDRMVGSLIKRLPRRDAVSDGDCIEWILDALEDALRKERDAVS